MSDAENSSQIAKLSEDESARLRGAALFSHSGDAILDVDSSGVITAFNPAAERIFGYSSSSVVGRSLGVLLPRHSPNELAEVLNRLATNAGAGPFLVDYLRSDGETHNLSVTAVPLTVGGSESMGYTIIARDLTDLRRSRAHLAASEERYRIMMESAHEGIGAIDTNGKIIFANSRLGEMLGYTPEAIKELSLPILFFPEDLSTIGELVERGLNRDTAVTEIRLRHKNGSPVWVILSTAPFLSDEGVVSVAGFLTDISDRKRSETLLKSNESLLRSYFEYVPVGIALSTLGGVIERVNPALITISGYESKNLLGSSLSLFLGLDETSRLDTFTKLVEELSTGDTPSIPFEIPFETKDGRSIWIQVTVSLMRDEAGDPSKLVSVIRDETQRKDADRIKAEFVSVTSHELRTPLTSIRGALGLLTGGVMGELPDSAQRMLEIAVESTDRLIRLINDILDLERLSSGNIPLALQECEAQTLIERAIDEVVGIAELAEVETRIGTVEGKVWADADRVIQTLTNLIGNAIKFSPSSSVVTVSAQTEGDHVRFKVQDHGPGIPADQLETIFGRFQQVDASDSRAKAGTGLGLAISRTIVEQHGGLIWADSAIGKGSIFNFTIPAVNDHGQQDSDELFPDPAVLVCDDDFAIREVVRTMLENSGFRVWTAANGEEALAIARHRTPDVILLDLLLPGMSGRDTALALSDEDETRDIPIVVLSVLTSAQMPVEHAMSRLEKPIEEDALMKALRAGLGAHGRQALVVEDDPQLTQVLATILSHHGLTVRTAHTGEAAKRLGRSFVPDLLVLDLSLPDCDGFSIIEWMRQQEWLNDVPVLVYTAWELNEADQERLRLGETRFVVKCQAPPEMFETTLSELLDWEKKNLQ